MKWNEMKWKTFDTNVLVAPKIPRSRQNMVSIKWKNSVFCVSTNWNIHDLRLLVVCRRHCLGSSKSTRSASVQFSNESNSAFFPFYIEHTRTHNVMSRMCACNVCNVLCLIAVRNRTFETVFKRTMDDMCPSFRYVYT